VGWQDRDYARLHDEELNAIYHFRRQRGSQVVGMVLGCIVVAVGGFWWTQRHPHSALYGSVVPSGPHAGSVCTEVEATDANGEWRCDTYVPNLVHAKVYPALPYRGACSHMKVAGRIWVCLTPATAGANT
jgi:hypothetical protein